MQLNEMRGAKNRRQQGNKRCSVVERTELPVGSKKVNKGEKSSVPLPRNSG